MEAGFPQGSVLVVFLLSQTPTSPILEKHRNPPPHDPFILCGVFHIMLNNILSHPQQLHHYADLEFNITTTPIPYGSSRKGEVILSGVYKQQ